MPLPLAKSSSSENKDSSSIADMFVSFVIVVVFQKSFCNYTRIEYQLKTSTFKSFLVD